LSPARLRWSQPPLIAGFGDPGPEVVTPRRYRPDGIRDRSLKREPDEPPVEAIDGQASLRASFRNIERLSAVP